MITQLDGCQLVSSTCANGSTMVSISGELDTVNADQVTRVLCDLVARDDVYVGLRELRFIDSSGLRALVRVAHAAREEGRSFRLVHLTPRAAKVIEVAGLAELLGVDDLGERPEG